MIFEKLKSRFGGGREQSEPVSGNESHLFRCESCETVYIDTEKQSCPQCEGIVKQIPADVGESEPSERYRRNGSE